MYSPGALEVQIPRCFLQHIDAIGPSYGRASYMLIANATSRYEADTFGLAASVVSEVDIVGPNFVSEQTLKHADAALSNDLTWDQRCDRFENGMATICRAMTPEAELPDLGAGFINMPKWRTEVHRFRASIRNSGHMASALPRLATRAEGLWPVGL
ncbi:hypothetical protein LX32DRAFT_689023 [Colletotrichum zoysiae]|uniref:Uncharacterized protein n=1 Tax=Colletotrichum zoysiae TaxID=1216348 RepID=A0AAD9HVI8_9PEZI|nr:hypothetical protein LX32DRAFT_689023 [Colletotrichum zoysiae]